MSANTAEGSLFSPHWYRVAELRPRLRGHIEAKRQSQRGRVWRLLVNPASHKIHRINDAAYAFVGRCDGNFTANQIWEALLSGDAEAAPTQDEILRLLAGLHQAELLQFDKPPDFSAVLANRRMAERRERQAGIRPLSFRIPLFDPTPLLRRIEQLLPPVLRETGFALALALIVGAIPMAVFHADEIRSHAAAWLDSPRYLLAMALIYPLMKGVHELAHGLAVRRGGGEVGRMGIALLMLMPVPYVDARAASGFRLARHRAIVSAAGIFAELLIAALALFAWLLLQPGLPRDLAFVAFFVGVFSSLLVNGNPLLRFDGYFLLCDALGLPNLGPRSARWWAERLRRLAGQSSPTASELEPVRGETAWLVAYLPLSLAYRLWLSVAIIVWLGGISFMLGTLAAMLIGYGLLVKPAHHFFSHLGNDDTGSRKPAWRRWLPLAVIVLLFATPVPFATMAQGVVWVPEQAEVRVESDGFIVELPVADGQAITAGQLLARLENEDLRTDRENLAGQLLAQQSQLLHYVRHAPERSLGLAEAMERTRGELELIDKRIANLEVTAGGVGKLIMPRQADRLGGFAGRGDTLGYVLDDAAPMTVQVALPHQQAVLVREETRRIDVLLPDTPFRSRAAIAAGVVSAATDTLPSAALSISADGEIVTDPADKRHLKTREPVVLLDLTVPDAASNRIGTRVRVRFDHGWLPLAAQLLRHGQQMWLRHFNPAE